ncbi:hypothetical protein AMJ80_02285 [bacterium SM23_31]|nr:MAG: hypothetical protein AMJ80_02285 [bacterium SM23_31]
MHITPSLEEFKRLAHNYSHIPLLCELCGDFDTPVSLYTKIRKKSSYSFLLESAVQSGSSGRYSFIGFNPNMVIKSSGRKISVLENGEWRTEDEEPVTYLRSVMARYSIPKLKDAPPFIGGLVGYIAYDAIRIFERIPDSAEDDLHIDDFLFLLADNLIVYDHYHHSIKIISITACDNNPESTFLSGCDKIVSISQMLKKSIESNYNGFEVDKHDKLTITPNMTPSVFMKNVQVAKEYIAAGDIFQIVLSQRFSVPIRCDGFDIYRRLRSMNPSPYMFYFHCNDTIVAGSSPEVLVKCRDGIVTTRPLAGTRTRGFSGHDDHKTAEELLNDEKERAEHVMLVDLARNDLGRFCKYGSIQIPEFMGIERYSHVMHIVSEVTGRLENNKDSFDILQGGFPAGTVSGAPKIRAMEIIDELEPLRRGVYAGAVGYLDFHNNMDTCIAIRTLVIKNNTAYIQAGAGIVADSVPENEYYETIHKAHVLIKAVAQAEGKTYDFGN